MGEMRGRGGGGKKMESKLNHTGSQKYNSEEILSTNSKLFFYGISLSLPSCNTKYIGDVITYILDVYTVLVI